MRRPRALVDTGPLYVMATDPRTGTVTVGSRKQLRSTTVHVRDLRWYLPGPVPKGARVRAQLRYRAGGDGVPARLARVDEQAASAELRLDEPAHAPAPGQAACLYDDHGVVVGVATIVRPPGSATAPDVVATGATR